MKQFEYEKLFSTISEMTDGLAAVCTNSGQILVSGNKKLKNLPIPVMTCLQDTVKKRHPVAVRVHDGVTIAVVHIDENKWLVMDNSGKIAYEKEQKMTIIKALPFIAQIAGGNATIFNSDGIRENAYFPDGTEDVAAIGEYQKLYESTLKEMRPTIGPAFFVKGANAVRIPVTKKFGLAFNNQQSIKRQQRLIDENRTNKYAHYQFSEILGISTSIREAKKIARTVAKTNSTVLLFGETGTGKEMFAQAIHNASDRATNPFVAINCGAIPENLVESILFGYTEGVFTGAGKIGNIGAFEQADKGTLFLDEISEMPMELQVRLLRTIQEREITRVGECQPIKVNVRIIAAANLKLAEMVEAGKFRADLYFRLNVLTVHIPSLRDRPDDIKYLFDYFLNRFAEMMRKSDLYLEMPLNIVQTLVAYHWPGNVRELQNCAEYVVNVLEKGDSRISLRHLPYYILEASEGETQSPQNSNYEEYMHKREHEFLSKAFKQFEGNKSQMAKILGVNRTTLIRLLKKHGIN